MNTVKIYKGLWRLPDVLDKQIPGILTVEKNKIVLETIDCVEIGSPIFRFVTKNVPFYDVIWGISSDAKKISIFNSYESISFNSDSHFPTAKYNAQFVTIGKRIFPIQKEAGEMNLFQLNCFLAVAEHMNFARAAAELHVTNPAVSQQIRSL